MIIFVCCVYGHVCAIHAQHGEHWRYCCTNHINTGKERGRAELYALSTPHPHQAQILASRLMLELMGPLLLDPLHSFTYE